MSAPASESVAGALPARVESRKSLRQRYDEEEEASVFHKYRFIFLGGLGVLVVGATFAIHGLAPLLFGASLTAPQVALLQDMILAVGAGAAVMVAVMGLGLSLVPTAGMGTNFDGLTGWIAMDMAQLAQVGAAGAFLIVGYLCAVTAMRWGDIGVVAPFRYTSLLWAIVLGFAAFGELPDGWTMVGSAIVVASGIYTLLRERQKRRMAAVAARAEG